MQFFVIAYFFAIVNPFVTEGEKNGQGWIKELIPGGLALRYRGCGRSTATTACELLQI